MELPEHKKKSLSKRLVEALSVVFVCGIFTSLHVSCSFLALYIIIYSKYWLPMILYLMWIWILDVRIPEQGGRLSVWIRSLKQWKHAKEYFPIKLVLLPGLELDAKKNYLLCCHPHGIVSFGLLSFLNHTWSNAEQLSKHTFYYFTVRINFLVPFSRDLFLAMGCCQSSVSSINTILCKPGGGNVGVLLPGGIKESAMSEPGIYRIFIKNRKGFIKVALKNGCPIVPAFSFGEVDTLFRVPLSKTSFIRKIQKWIECVTYGAPMWTGRAYLPIPARLPIHVVVGRPINIPKVENPSQENIDSIHTEYIKKITELFEEQKHNYLTNPDRSTLLID